MREIDARGTGERTRYEAMVSQYGVPPTAEEIRATVERARERIGRAIVSTSATIADYPIGARNRGQCRIEVERVKGKGYRSIKTTTNRDGLWCAPKKSTYRPYPMAVMAEPDGNTCWISFDDCGLYLTRANGDSERIVKAPCTLRPNRKERRYTVRSSTRVYNGNGLSAPTEGPTEERVLEADPVEFCDAWDLQFNLLVALMGEVVDRAGLRRE
jgi:hypothetical protein